MDATIKAAAERVAPADGTTSTNEVEIKIKLSSNYVLRRISEGGKLSFDIRSDHEASVVAKRLESFADAAEPLKALRDQTDAQMALDDALRETGEVRELLSHVRSE